MNGTGIYRIVAAGILERKRGRKENNMKIYEVEERTPLVAPLLNIWEEIWYSKLWNQGSYRQRAESTGSWIL